MTSRYLTASQAARELSIRVPTLYAYVSRGWIRSEQAGGTRRERRYNAEDVQRLKERKEQRHNPSRVAEQALHWGAPVLESSLTLIADGKLYYRGYDVLSLAGQYSIEQVAALLWTGDLAVDVGYLFGRTPHTQAEQLERRLCDAAHLSIIERFQLALATEEEDAAGYDLRPNAVAQTGAHILQRLASVAAGKGGGRGGIARRLQEAWAPKSGEAARLLDAALVLCADHELNISAFTARCVASTGASPYAAVVAALAALQGPKHGGATRRVEALVREIATPGRARSVLANRLKRGEAIPGFGHALYPEGDPRGRLLLEMTADAFPRSRRAALGKTIVREAFNLIGEHPTVDLALVVLAQTLGLPDESPIALFALGRTVGWVAHAIEQYPLDRLIRPRARYVGPPPRG